MFILVGLQENTHTMIEKTNQLKTAHCAQWRQLKNYAFFKLALFLLL